MMLFKRLWLQGMGKNISSIMIKNNSRRCITTRLTSACSMHHPSAFFGHADYTQPMWREMKRNEVKTILVLAIVVAILAITSAVGDPNVMF